MYADFCSSGSGVANDYCYKFEQIGQCSVDSRALVKLTPSEVSTIKSAGRNGLGTDYRDDRFVYYISESGSPMNWHGFSGNANDGVSAPYIICTEHNKKAWDDYHASLETNPPTDGGSGDGTEAPGGNHIVVG